MAALSVAIPERAGASVVLYDTGVDSAGTPLSIGSIDTHWTIVSGPGITAPVSAVASAIYGLYAVDSHSTWIWVNGDAAAGIGSPYTFRLSFSLTAAEAAGFSLSGAWAADNFGDILLNGIAPVGSGSFSMTDSVIKNFDHFHPFTITGGFVSGVNTLDFVITDTGGVAGLDVAGLTAISAPPGAVPEPSVLLLLPLGLVAASSGARNRFKRRAPSQGQGLGA